MTESNIQGLPPIILILVLFMVFLVFLIKWRYPQFWLAIKAILAGIGLNKKLDQETLDKIIYEAGYSYDPDQDIFYSNLYAWQRDMGYCRLYDEAAIISGMIIDCEPIYFSYNGKRWLIEFWKGQYGMTTGFEIGVYNTSDFDLTIPELFKGTFYKSAGDHELLYLSGSLKKNGATLFTRHDVHWWLTGFKLGEFSEPDELVLDLSITLRDRTMRDAFIKGLYEAGYSPEEIISYGTTVNLRFDKPKTPQPIARTAPTDWLTQRKNEFLCETYQEITAPYDTLLDKINAIITLSPGTYRQLNSFAKGKPSMAEYRAIKKHTSAPLPASVKKVTRVFKRAAEIPFDDSSKFILMCDCHRGNGSWGDDFARNRNLYMAALKHYYRNNYTYIEIGDGDELWENKELSGIINVHRDVFQLLAKFHRDNRLYFIFGNHDMVKRNPNYLRDNLFQYFDEREKRNIPLFENIKVHEGLVLKYRYTGDRILLTHGHQVDFFSYEMWRIARFLARYLWKPLNVFGINDPTSTAKNYKKKQRIEKRLTRWVMTEKQMLISGHTHRPMFPEPGEPPYFNGGSIVHPQDITGIEITNGCITLVKWNVQTSNYGRLYVKREVLAGPVRLKDYFITCQE